MGNVIAIRAPADDVEVPAAEVFVECLGVLLLAGPMIYVEAVEAGLDALYRAMKVGAP